MGSILFLSTLGEDWSVALNSAIERFSPTFILPERAIAFLGGFDSRQQLIAAAALIAYAALHGVEGYGLWKNRRWGEWLGTLSGGVYIPFEIYEMIEYPSGITAAVLALNTFVVGYLIYVIRTNRKREPRLS